MAIGDLEQSDLVNRGGSWGGLIFDNPRLGIPPGLSWSFTFDYERIHREYGEVGPTLTIEWVSFEAPSWRHLAGHIAASSYGDPIESSVYFFEHYRYDFAKVTVEEMRATDLLVHGRVAGDIDGLGVGVLEATAWLTFTGVKVSVSRPPRSPRQAAALARHFTGIDGLTPVRNGNSFILVAA